jgi:hypothetical protein
VLLQLAGQTLADGGRVGCRGLDVPGVCDGRGRRVAVAGRQKAAMPVDGFDGRRLGDEREQHEDQQALQGRERAAR